LQSKKFSAPHFLQRSWFLRPEVLYLRNESNSLWANYSSTEIWLMVRKSF